MSPPCTCVGCGLRPVAMRGTKHCFECWPGGPVLPPPCWRCGSVGDYFADGMCSRCHYYAPQRVDACRDCYAWGAERLNKWLCQGCRRWRRLRAVGTCAICRRVVPLDEDDYACRLCHKQGTLMRPMNAHLDLVGANRHGHQLFLADMFRSRSPRHLDVDPQRYSPAPSTFHPNPCRQLVLLDLPRDLQAGLQHGFPEPRDPVQAAFLNYVITDHARWHGWSKANTEIVRRAVRILLGIQDSPGALINANEVTALTSIRLPAAPVLAVLASAGLLDDDRVPTVQRWFERHITDLPDTMKDELHVWFHIMLHGSNTPPRRRPRDPHTIRAKLRWALPALHSWADAGLASLREVSRDDVLAALPSSGAPRATMGGGLRSIFQILKARKVTFTDPTRGIRLDAIPSTQPLPLALDKLREALHSLDPLRAFVAALQAFHALEPRQLLHLQLTDVRDGRLRLNGRIIPLGQPVVERLTAFLDYRRQRFPHTANPHLFVNHYSAGHTGPTHRDWINRRLGLSAQAIREDRILEEARATGGDVRRLCDLFGLSVSGAERYTSCISHPDLNGTRTATQ